MTTENLPVTYNPVDALIADWLAAKAGKSNSKRTADSYRDTMADFRGALAQRDADLLSEPALVALAAEQWATSSRTGRTVTPATFNLRLAIISSFYVYLAKKAILSNRHIVNPIQSIDRRKVKAYARALPLETKDVKASLKGIDRSTLQGKRDYALLTVLTVTGRRLSEVANMKRGDLVLGDRIKINFPRTKGGDEMNDLLTAKQSAAVLDYLYALHGAALGSLTNDAPIWVSLSRRNYGKPMGIQTVGDVCKKYLGTSKVHTLRHTFAVAMEQAGAPISAIQKRLGHKNAATTSIYLEQLHSAENAFAGQLDDLFGTGD